MAASAPNVSCCDFVFTGPYAPLYWTMLACNVVVPQAAVVRRGARRACRPLLAIAIAINIGMWLERILIIWNTLVARLPAHPCGVLFHPTFWDWATLATSFGLFAFLFLVLRPAGAGGGDARREQAGLHDEMTERA